MASAWPMIARCWGNGEDFDVIVVRKGNLEIKLALPGRPLWWVELEGVPWLTLMSVKLG